MNRLSLMERLTGAFRARDLVGTIQFEPAFYDLAPSDRVQAAAEAAALRRIEAALDPDQLSTTAHAVMERVRAAGRRVD